MTSALYDFRSPTPLAPELSQQLDLWFAETVRRAAKSWPRVLKSPAELRTKGYELAAAEDCPAYIPEGAVAVRLAIGSDKRLSLLVLPRALVLVLLGAALAEAIPALPAERELTKVEESLCDYLLRALFADLFRETWAGTAGLTLEIREREVEPREARLFPAEEGVLVCTFQVVGPFGEVDWCWLLPRSGWMEELAPTAREEEKPDMVVATPQMAALARLLPVELSVRLGTAELTLSQIEGLRAGDLILLDQEINQPLVAAVAGAEKFLVAPGAVGNRQGVRIQSLTLS